uniref:Uncharacterized protein n=1 Tax=Brassica oleracea TaxID=3712 RepID=A0A3P6CNY8_BRAOL|nr:unnamed protein product [Brassica oleracea]
MFLHHHYMEKWRRSKRRKPMTPPMASPPTSVIFSVRRAIETRTDGDCIGPHGVCFGFSRVLRQKTDRQ